LTDLPEVYDSAGKVLAKEDYTTWKLTAFKYYYIPLDPIGLGARRTWFARNRSSSTRQVPAP
jgi:hypothetical protein